MMGWRPIETAPRDGSAILLCEMPYDWIAVGKWRGPEHSPVPWVIESGFQVGATHWMPLPPAPESEGK